MKILVTGANGQLGHDVISELRERKMACQGVDACDFDISNEGAVNDYLTRFAPTAVIHCAAYTAVDKAETDIQRCTEVNVDGTRYIATACRELGAKLMYISTDYVFSGTGDCPHEVDDQTDAIGVYGITKALGEQMAQCAGDKLFIVRTAWAFGMHGKNFVTTMLRLAQKQSSVNVVCDQIGSPTYTVDLAELLCNMIVTEKYGVYHATNEGYCSVADWAEEILKIAGLTTQVHRISTEQYASCVKRPLNSRMSKAHLLRQGFSLLPPWQDAVHRFLQAANNV